MQQCKLNWIYKLLCIISVSLFINCVAQNESIHILIVTGGHDFEEESFFNMFVAMKDVAFTHRIQPEANQSFITSDLDSFDVIVFYDMINSITDKEKQAFIRLLKNGKNMLFLHHALCSYQDWPEFEKILGGKYLIQDEIRNEKTILASTYKHDVDVPIHIVKEDHSVTHGLEDFTLFDEVYGGFMVRPDVTLLLKTDHPESTPEIGWTHRYENSQIVYMQPGHGRHAFENSNYRQLAYQAIMWLCGKTQDI
ncbi:ThuA domain-containing protein [candidate division KSB1 bacterium]|nr:ThuA domain-containing protein [candidate division KSB1 bacterium]